MAVRLLTTEEVAARFRTSPATVRYWRHIGIGPSSGVRRHGDPTIGLTKQGADQSLH
jgi:hypothetical protein